MTLLAKMDQLVYATGLDRLLSMQMRPRSLRWTPLLVFAALIVGYVLMARNVDRPDRAFFAGGLLFYVACVAAALLRIFGPRFVPSAVRPLDEREMTVKMRAYALSGILLTGATMLGCFYIASAGLTRFWQPHSPNDWIALAFGVQAAAMLVPTMIASWIEPRAISDQDD